MIRLVEQTGLKVIQGSRRIQTCINCMMHRHTPSYIFGKNGIAASEDDYDFSFPNNQDEEIPSSMLPPDYAVRPLGGTAKATREMAAAAAAAAAADEAIKKEQEEKSYGATLDAEATSTSSRISNCGKIGDNSGQDPDPHQEEAIPHEEPHSGSIATNKWYRRPSYLTLFALLACILVIVIAVAVVLSGRGGTSPDSSGSDPNYTHGSNGADASAPGSTEPATISPTSSAPADDGSPVLSSDEKYQIACDFLSIPNLAQCRATKKFDVLFYDQSSGSFDNTFGSTIPSEIGLMTQMTHMSFAGEDLIGSIPSTFSSLTLLTSLEFRRNAFTGSIPPSLSSLTQLQYLSFLENNMNGTIPSSFSILTQLTYLNFESNQFYGSTIPSSLCSVPELHFDCDGTIECSCCSYVPAGCCTCGAV